MNVQNLTSNACGSLLKVTRSIGVDRAVGYTLIGRGWALAASMVTLWIIARCLTKNEQGFYYTFASILALQIIFDLGLSYVVLQFASHEMAHLKIGENGVVSGDPIAKARMASLLWFATNWYGVVALLVMIVVIPAGMFFFGTHRGSDLSVIWRVPWIALGITTGGLLLISPLSAIVEGTGQVAEIALMRTFQNIIASSLLWVALLLGWRLYAAPVFSGASFLCAIAWLILRHGVFFRNLLASRDHTNVIGWWTEIWPFQWKIAVSWLSGYFIGQLFNPIMFAFHGPAAAGQMGMSLTVAAGISTVALAWVTTKAAPFGQMVAKRDFDQLDRIFFRCLWQSFMIVVTAASVAFFTLLYLRHIHSPISQRMLDPLPFGLLLLSTVINHVVVSEAIYLRAHKQEPFLWTSVAIGILVATSAYWAGKYYGAIGITVAYCIISISVGLGIGTAIFIRKRRIWHVKECECVLQ